MKHESPDTAHPLAELEHQAEAEVAALLDAEAAAVARSRQREAEEDAARIAKAKERARKAARARWRNGPGEKSVAVRLFEADVGILLDFRLWDGKRTTPAAAVRRLLVAAQGILWNYDDRGRVVVVGQLRDTFRRRDTSGGD